MSCLKPCQDITGYYFQGRVCGAKRIRTRKNPKPFRKYSRREKFVSVKRLVHQEQWCIRKATLYLYCHGSGAVMLFHSDVSHVLGRQSVHVTRQALSEGGNCLCSLTCTDHPYVGPDIHSFPQLNNFVVKHHDLTAKFIRHHIYCS
jgi:hypothetical protein